MSHSQETIDEICKLRKARLSCEKIAKLTGLTKNTVLALVYKHYLKIDRHKLYKAKKIVNGVEVAGRELRPSVAFVKGLVSNRYYVVRDN